ncbi:MAG: hypothetical protein KAU48_14375 [Candidatus Thorarchaeota archaeon]|nr:hypothetical protein [Candidatus Thorarchaeota archaeon]
MQQLVWPQLCIGCGSEDTALAKHTESGTDTIKVDFSQPGRVTYRYSTESHLNMTSSLCTSCKLKGAAIRERDLYPAYRSILNILLVLVILEVSLIVCLASPSGLVRAIVGMSATGLGVLIVFLVPALLERKRTYNDELGPFIRLEHVRSGRKYRQGFVFGNQTFMQAFKEANPGIPVCLHTTPHLARIIEMDWEM